MTTADRWLTKQPDIETVAAIDTILSCQAAKQKARAAGCMDDWVHFDRLEAKAQAFLRG